MIDLGILNCALANSEKKKFYLSPNKSGIKFDIPLENEIEIVFSLILSIEFVVLRLFYLPYMNQQCLTLCLC